MKGKGLWMLGGALAATGLAAYLLTRKKWWKDYEPYDGAIITSKGNIVKVTAGEGAHPAIIYRILDYKSFIGKTRSYGVWVLVPPTNTCPVNVVMHATPSRSRCAVNNDGTWHWIGVGTVVPANVTELDYWIINTGAGGTGAHFYVANPRLAEGDYVKPTPEPRMPTF